MLTELFCKAFMSNGAVRPKVSFNAGLNIVLGDSDASNSIGKSTFLLILDFVFGGEDYIVKAPDVHKNVGRHEICFSLKFGDKKYFFCRDTVEYRAVSVCNDKYKKVKQWTIAQYNDFLKIQYLSNAGTLSFRDAVSRYSRIYQKDNHNERQPLEVVAKESQRQAIVALLKVFGRYDLHADARAVAEEAADKCKVYTGSVEYSFIQSLSGVKALKQVEKECAKLRVERNRLDDPQALKARSVVELQDIADLKRDLQKLRAVRSHILGKIHQLERTKSTSPNDFVVDLAVLSDYFPGVNLRKIEEVERFHVALTSILGEEIDEELTTTRSDLEKVSAEIDAKENKLASYDIPTGISKGVLNEYARLTKRLDELEAMKNNYLKHSELKREKIEYSKHYQNLIKNELIAVQSEICGELLRLNERISEIGKKPPVLNISPDGGSYVFETPDDTGTGTNYKGMIMFDLAVANLTQIPFLIHDSILFANISKSTVGRILSAYITLGKQVFIAFDKASIYDEQTRAMIAGNTVLELSNNGNELFGRSWSRA